MRPILMAKRDELTYFFGSKLSFMGDFVVARGDSMPITTDLAYILAVLLNNYGVLTISETHKEYYHIFQILSGM